MHRITPPPLEIAKARQAQFCDITQHLNIQQQKLILSPFLSIFTWMTSFVKIVLRLVEIHRRVEISYSGYGVSYISLNLYRARYIWVTAELNKNGWNREHKIRQCSTNLSQTAPVTTVRVNTVFGLIAFQEQIDWTSKLVPGTGWCL